MSANSQVTPPIADNRTYISAMSRVGIEPKSFASCAAFLIASRVFRTMKVFIETIIKMGPKKNNRRAGFELNQKIGFA